MHAAVVVNEALAAVKVPLIQLATSGAVAVESVPTGHVWTTVSVPDVKVTAEHEPVRDVQSPAIVGNDWKPAAYVAVT